MQQAIALVLLLAFSPLLLIIACIIYCTDGSPVLFEHYRVGLDGHMFACLKFRTMRRDAEQSLAHLLESSPASKAAWERDHKLHLDPRVTQIGAFLRKTSLDELPQLINVLRGQMAFVGPRPVTPSELDRYGNVRWHYLSLRPGLTGLWQVSGRNRTSYARRVELDRIYVETHNWWMDAGILLRTVYVVLTGHGAS